MNTQNYIIEAKKERIAIIDLISNLSKSAETLNKLIITPPEGNEPYDYCVDNKYTEVKVRQYHQHQFDSSFIEQTKWKQLKELETEGCDVYYMCFYFNSILIYKLKNIPEPKWKNEPHNIYTCEPSKRKYKIVGYIPYTYATHINYISIVYKNIEVDTIYSKCLELLKK